MSESRDVPAAAATTVDSSVEASAADRATAQLAKVVASARRTAGLTLAATAAGSGLSPAYISQIESGSANPTVQQPVPAPFHHASRIDRDVGQSRNLEHDGP